MTNRACFVMVVVLIAATSGISAQVRDIMPYRMADASENPTGEREILHYRVYGDGVVAEFVTEDTSTCDLGVQTIVTVHGRQHVTYVNGDPTEENKVSVVVTVFDRCAGIPLMVVTGNGLVEHLHLNPNLKSASLRASFEGMEWLFENPVSITVDVVWNGAGRPERTSDHLRYDAGTERLVSNSNGEIRDAVAGGTITVDSVDYTPLPSIYGVIEKNSTRTLTFYR